jgi:hypothetical protein
LVLYNRLGESTADETIVLDDEEWVQERKRVSDEVQEELAKQSGRLRDRQIELGAYTVLADLVDVLSARARDVLRRRAAARARQAAVRCVGIPSPAKRAKTSFDFQQYVGRRVAKAFSLEDKNDPNMVVEEIFFGTVAHISNPKRVWFFVEYDDGDNEEYNLDDLDKGLQLYEVRKEDDERKEVPPKGDAVKVKIQPRDMGIDGGAGKNLFGVSRQGVDGGSVHSSSTAATAPQKSGTGINVPVNTAATIPVNAGADTVSLSAKTDPAAKPPGASLPAVAMANERRHQGDESAGNHEVIEIASDSEAAADPTSDATAAPPPPGMATVNEYQQGSSTNAKMVIEIDSD